MASSDSEVSTDSTSSSESSDSEISTLSAADYIYSNIESGSSDVPSDIDDIPNIRSIIKMLHNDPEIGQVSDDEEDSDDLQEMSIDEEMTDQDEENSDYSMVYESEKEEEDPDNPMEYEEPDDYTCEEVLNLIWGYALGEEESGVLDIDTRDIGYEEIAERTTEATILKVIRELTNDDKENNAIANFDAVKNLVAAKDIQIDDSSIFEHYLQYAASNLFDDVQDILEFVKATGFSLDDAKDIALKDDSSEILEAFEIEFDEDYFRSAVYNEATSIIEYFLAQDFVSSYEILIEEAIDERQPKWIDLVCKSATLDQVYDLIVFLTENNGENLIPTFFKHYDVKRLLKEIYRQDDGRGFFELVFNHAKDYLSQSDRDKFEIAKIIKEFDEKISIDSTLIYPPENFNGDKDLEKIRNMFNKNSRLSEESKVAANFIGVPLSTANHFFVKPPQHLQERKKSEHYFRSELHPLSVFVNGRKASAQYPANSTLPEANAKKKVARAAHLGLYKNTLDSLNSVKKIRLEKSKSSKKTNFGKSKLYDQLLNYKRKTCKYIVESKILKNNAIKVGFYNNYPCIMVNIKYPSRAHKKASNAALEAWTQIIISFFVGILNYEAQRDCLSIELVRRSSFGFLTPTISACGPSFRINIGIVPKEYIDLLIKCLNILDIVLTVLNRDNTYLNNNQLDYDLPKNCFVKTKAYKEYYNKDEIPVVNNILELVWAKIDTGHRTGAYNLVRTSAGRDGLAVEVYNALLAETTNKPVSYVQIFLNALKWGFSNMRVKNADSIKFDKTAMPIVLQPNFVFHTDVKDQEFFNFISRVLKIFEDEHSDNSLPVDNFIGNAMTEAISVIKDCIRKKSIDNLYYHLEKLLELFYSKAVFTYEGKIEDDFGSDSEVEEYSANGEKYVVGKKVIVQNGMRAILASLHAGANFLYPQYLKSSVKYNLSLQSAYYETAEAMKLLAKFNVFKDLDGIGKSRMLIYDINACEKYGEESAEINAKHIKNIKVLIIDSTSATTKDYKQWIKRFSSLPQIQVLFFVSSGIKHEQSSDRNPYGTIRVFAKDCVHLKKIIDFIKHTEKPIESGVSHHYRRELKKIGHIPTNKNITDFFSSWNDKSATTAKLPSNCNDEEEIKLKIMPPSRQHNL